MNSNMPMRVNVSRGLVDTRLDNKLPNPPRAATVDGLVHRDRVQCCRKKAAAIKRTEQQRLRRRSKRSSVRLHRRG
jgi:hypothetical protein